MSEFSLYSQATETIPKQVTYLTFFHPQWQTFVSLVRLVEPNSLALVRVVDGIVLNYLVFESEEDSNDDLEVAHSPYSRRYTGYNEHLGILTVVASGRVYYHKTIIGGSADDDTTIIVLKALPGVRVPYPCDVSLSPDGRNLAVGRIEGDLLDVYTIYERNGRLYANDRITYTLPDGVFACVPRYHPLVQGLLLVNAGVFVNLALQRLKGEVSDESHATLCQQLMDSPELHKRYAALCSYSIISLPATTTMTRTQGLPANVLFTHTPTIDKQGQVLGDGTPMWSPAGDMAAVYYWCICPDDGCGLDMTRVKLQPSGNGFMTIETSPCSDWTLFKPRNPFFCANSSIYYTTGVGAYDVSACGKREIRLNGLRNQPIDTAMLSIKKHGFCVASVGGEIVVVIGDPITPTGDELPTTIYALFTPAPLSSTLAFKP